MSSTVEQIKERLDIADVIGSYLKLANAGSNLKARCPFHNEKTPSFFVSPARQTYHCFGCGKGGDMFSFIQEIEGVDFSGALKILADRAGVEIKKTGSAQTSEREKLFAVLEDATYFFEQNLKTEKDVGLYLKERGLTGVTAKKFRLGYALDQWRALQDFLKKKGYDENLMEKAGLIIKGDKGHYDRFRNRIMFPIFDSSGRVVGFSGRIFDSGNKGNDAVSQAKYVNSPETQLYNKSKILYGFDKAKMAVRKFDSCILVEGQMDILLSHQAGFENTVAVSGTALTEYHLNLIKRLSDNLIVAFDPDDAGLSASKRGVDTALSLGFDVKVALLPQGLDPADLILKDKNEWQNIIEGASHVIDFYLDALSRKDMEQRDFRVKVGEIVLPYIARLKNKINQAHFVSEVARKLGISEEPIWEELRNISKNIKSEHAERTIETKDENKTTGTRKNMIERKILGLIFLQEEQQKPILNIEECKEKYKNIVGEDVFKTMEDLSDGDKKEFMFEAEVYYGDMKNIDKEFYELLKYLEEEILKEELARTMEKLRISENKGDSKLTDDILKKCQEISKKINELK